MKIFRCFVILIISILFISIYPLQSNASEPNNSNAPSPAPSSTVTITSGQPSVRGPPGVKETCKTETTRCQFKSMSACISSSEIGPQGSLVVVNDGESPVNVKITIFPANNTFMEIKIPRHQAEKIIIPANVGVGSSILFDYGDGNCTIHTRAPSPQLNFYQQFSSYNTYATPTNGAYLLLGISIIIGGTWACCKLKKADRHLDGVPYQELEMGNSNIPLSTDVDVDVEAAEEGWDQDWDDDWDEDKAVVKSPGGNLNGKSANGISSKSADPNGWGNDWDD